MIYLVVVLVAVTVGLVVTAGVAAVTGGEERTVSRQLAAIQRGDVGARQLEERRRRQARRDRLQGLLEAIGERVDVEDERTTATRRFLQRAGIRHPKAVVYYYAARVVTAVALGVLALLLGSVAVLGVVQTVLITAVAAVLGWILPFLYIRLKVRRRQDELRRTLPDALDLMVVCVEAGLGLNQALVRVGEEMDRISPAMSDELTVVSLEIRAGTPRPEALRNLSKRTGVEDIQSLVGMLIQTDRFGTSVARALRVHSDSLRTKRRQRAEEEAAKTSIKMLFPLVFFIFPAMFVVILGPAVFHITEVFGGS